jgi:hypothetical protein
MEVKSRDIILEWAKSLDVLCHCANDHTPESIWTLPPWAIDNFPTRQVFMSVQSQIERHFGMKLDNSITYSVAGILSSEGYVSSSMSDPKPTASFAQPPMTAAESAVSEWIFTPPPPFQQQQTRTTLVGPSASSVRIYLCVHAGNQSGDFLRFFDSRALRSKDNPMNVGGELSLECPSWFTLMAWSDHKSQVKMPRGDHTASKQFWVIVLDASRVRRKVTFSDVDLLECEQLVRESGYGNLKFIYFKNKKNNNNNILFF